MSGSELPSSITHPSHSIHHLTLLPSPAYLSGAFICDGCRRIGLGFSYHCSHCQFDLHTTCAQYPLLLSHHSHSHHILDLTFHPPYPTFSCGICHQLGFNHWLYSCGVCQFHAHLDCAMGVGLPAQPQHNQNSAGQSSYGRSQIMGALHYGYPQPVVQGFVYGAAQRVGQNFVQSIIGGGGNNGNNINDPDVGGGDFGGDA